MCKLLNGVIFINSTLIFSCGLYENIFYVKYLIQVSESSKINFLHCLIILLESLYIYVALKSVNFSKYREALPHKVCDTVCAETANASLYQCCFTMLSETETFLSLWFDAVTLLLDCKALGSMTTL